MFPQRRMRRLRADEFSRALSRETVLTSSDLILPVFIVDKEHGLEPIASMPNTFRHGMQELLATCERCVEAKIPAVALFPLVDSSKKSPEGNEAFNANGLVPRAIREIKQRFPQLGIIADVALDCYTSHGHDGVVDHHGYVLNDETLVLLRQQALCYAEAGADFVAPSDMMDGRVGAIRESLDHAGFMRTRILSYAVKYNSALYGPFRDAVGSGALLGKKDKSTYQLDPANRRESLLEAALDVSEGADMLMVKPGTFYLDILWQMSQQFDIPCSVYQVSGEYSMLCAAFEKGWLDRRKSVLESLIAFKRAGAAAILSYFALEAAQYLRD